MRHLLAMLALASLIVACSASFVGPATKDDSKCGGYEYSCGNGYCCPRGHTCGTGAWGCPDGQCCDQSSAKIGAARCPNTPQRKASP